MSMPKDTLEKKSVSGLLTAITLFLVVALVIIVALTLVLPKNQKGILNETENARIWTFGDSGISLITKITKNDDGNLSWKRYVKCPDGSQVPLGSAENHPPEDFYSRFEIQEASLTPECKIIYFTRAGRFYSPCCCKQ